MNSISDTSTVLASRCGSVASLCAPVGTFSHPSPSGALTGSPCHLSRLFSAGGLRRPRGEQHGRRHPGGDHWEAAARLAGLRRRLGHQPEVLVGVAGRQPLLLQQTGPVAPPEPPGQPQLPEGEEHAGARETFVFFFSVEDCATSPDRFYFPGRRLRPSTII